MYPLFAIYFVGAFGISFVSLWRKYRVVRGSERLRIRYLFVGTFLAVVGGATTNLLIPLVFRTSRFNLLGPLFTVFAITFIAHAIVRHRLMDIRVVLRQSTTYALSFVLCGTVLIGIPALVYSLFDSGPAIDVFTMVGVAILVAAVFPPLFRSVRRRLDRYAYRASYDQSKTLAHVTRTLSSFLDRDGLLRYIRSVVYETVPSENIAFYLRCSGGYALYQFGDVGILAVDEPDISAEDSIVVHLADPSTALVREEVSPQLDRSHSDLFRNLSARNWDLLLPFRTERQLSGFIALGPKLSGDPYFEADIELLGAIAGQTAVALANATLYQEVRDVKDHLESILKDMEGGVVAVSATATITTANVVAAGLLGLHPSDLIGKPLSSLPAVLSIPLETTIREGVTTAQLEAELVSHLGPTPIVLSTSLLRDAEGAIRGAILVFGDHTKIKELEDEKRRSERLADFRNMAFGIAHEIKNPLVAIKTFAELLPERYGDLDFRENFLRVAVGEIDRIDELVARLRGLGEPESRPLQNIDLVEPLNDTLRLLEGQLSQRGIQTLRRCGPNIPRIQGDFAQLKQLFLNLLLNAIEAMENGGLLTVTVGTRRQRDGSTAVIVEIRDTGIGISDAVSARLFDPFVTSKPRGSGLGLSISRGIADAHHATIRITGQTEPPGTLVTVEFPALPS
jgi:signal transduction histidine kinase